MEKFCIINKLKTEHVEEYCELHRNCWPEMRQALIDAGAQNCIVFVNGTQSILIYECDDLDESFAKLGENEVNKKWQDLVSPWFDNPEGFELTLADKVFDLHEE
jgi:L-rhamnose mutarotase